jgi:hypothetical protein
MTSSSTFVFRALLVALPIAFALKAPAHAQVVLGHVVEAELSAPIKHATLELLNDRAQVISRVNVDSVGVFRIRSWHPGKYRIRTSALGFVTVTSEFMEVATGDVIDLTIRLDAKAVPLEPVVVNVRARASLSEIAMAGYYDRRDAGQRLGLGRFFDRGAIARRGRKLSEVLATIPGVGAARQRENRRERRAVDDEDDDVGECGAAWKASGQSGGQRPQTAREPGDGRGDVEQVEPPGCVRRHPRTVDDRRNVSTAGPTERA